MYEPYVKALELPRQTPQAYPYTIPAVPSLATLQFSTPVTFFVGENGSGKSTIIEAIAVAAGFNAEGGTKNYHFTTIDSTSELADVLTIVRGTRRERNGYFLRAESFYTTANYIEAGTYPTGETPEPMFVNNKRVHMQSHGEAFLGLVKDASPGLFIFDEPESALSPQRQLALMVAMNELVNKQSQFIIATHSPILLAYPGATILELSDTGIEKAHYETLDHVTLTRDFLSDPNRYFDKLFAP